MEKDIKEESPNKLHLYLKQIGFNQLPVLYKVLVILSLILLFFKTGIDRSLFESLCDFYIVNFYNSIFSLIIVISIFGFTIVFVLRKIFSGYKPIFQTYILYPCFLFIYLYFYRFSNQYSWELISLPMQKINVIKYIDLILLSTLFVSIKFIKRIVIPKNKDNGRMYKFLEDNIESFESKDLLNATFFSNNISNFINDTNNKKAFSIGIVGEWGYGKSVLIKFLRDELEQKRIIFIEFKPWSYRKETDLVGSFLAQVADELSHYSPKLGKDIAQYSENLKELTEDIFSKTLYSINNLFNGNSIEELLNTLKEEIESLNRKVVVIIDDLDRLRPEEIFEVLKIIRTSFDFPNTFFVVAYDSDYLDRGIKKSVKIKHNKRYAEKIFQIEFSVSPPIKQIIVDEFEKQLIKDYSEDDKNLLRMAIKELNIKPPINSLTHIGGLLEDSLENLRDVVRLINELKLAFSCIEPADINAFEFILLKLLKVKHYNVYLLLKNREILKADSENLSNRIILNEEVIDTKNFSVIVNRILAELFQLKRPTYISLNNPNNFNAYFGQHIYGRISYSKYKKGVSGGYIKFKEFIQGTIANGLGPELKIILLETNSFFDQTSFETIIKGELDLARHDLDSILISDLFTKTNKIGSIINKIYPTLESYQSFLLDTFHKEAEYPYFVEAKILNSFLYVYIKKIKEELLEDIFELENLQKYILELFKRYLQHPQTNLNNISFAFYYLNLNSIDPQTNEIILNYEAGENFKKFILDHPLDFLKSILRPQYVPSDEVHYTFEPFIKQYFGWENFVSFLKENINDEKANLLLSKISEYEETGYKYFTSSPTEMKIFE